MCRDVARKVCRYKPSEAVEKGGEADHTEEHRRNNLVQRAVMEEVEREVIDYEAFKTDHRRIAKVMDGLSDKQFDRARGEYEQF